MAPFFKKVRRVTGEIEAEFVFIVLADMMHPPCHLTSKNCEGCPSGVPRYSYQSGDLSRDIRLLQHLELVLLQNLLRDLVILHA